MMRFFTYFHFFKYVKLHFGYQTFSILKNCIKLMKLVVSLRIQFLRACIKSNLIPSHLDKHKRYSYINLYDINFTKILDSIYERHVRTVLHLELKDAYKHLHYTRISIYNISKTISNILPPYLGTAFLNRQETNCYRLFHKEKTRIDRKIQWLMSKHHTVIQSRIKPISY